jgi:hypothetical protein
LRDYDAMRQFIGNVGWRVARCTMNRIDLPELWMKENACARVNVT